MHKDPHSGPPAGHGEPAAPLSPRPSDEAVKTAFDSMILSVSGFRKVFAADGDDDSLSTDISNADAIIAGSAAAAFAGLLKSVYPDTNITIAVGIDSRPTGPAVADAMCRVFLSRGITVRYFFIIPAPEIMAFVKNTSGVKGFCYVTASHNPPGHNGLKFGFSNGQVLEAKHALPLIEDLREIINKKDIAERLSQDMENIPFDSIKRVYKSASENKKAAYDAYLNFTQRVTAAPLDNDAASTYCNKLAAAVKKQPISIIGELNGSSRSVSIDSPLLASFNIHVKLFNNKAGVISHAIIPEGESLDECARLLENMHAEDPSFLFGYVPDNDGDRGNIVYINTMNGKAEILQAQQVFALVCLAECADLVYKGVLSCTDECYPGKGAALVVNGPTSLRIETLASVFGIEVFRTETGEANVVNKALELQTEGKIVRVIGEGSNGGNITLPSTVRDPLNTIISLVKLYCLRSNEAKPGLFEIWCSLRGREYNNDFTLGDVIDSLPSFCTTGVSEAKAVTKITTRDHAALKTAFEGIFLEKWRKEKKQLAGTYGFYEYEEYTTEGTIERKGFGPEFRTGNAKGGFKILFRDMKGAPAGFIWMRGSGTEPVFRTMVDLRGSDRSKMEALLDWHRSIVLEADKAAPTP